MTFKESIQTCLLDKYLSISGRASRSEYWWFCLFCIITITAYILLSIITISKLDMDYMWLAFVLSLFVIFIFLMIPLYCARIRRLHDKGLSGWLVLLEISSVGGLVIFVITILKGDEGTNDYGPNPNEIETGGQQ